MDPWNDHYIKLNLSQDGKGLEREAKKVGPGFNKDLFLKSELMFFSDHSKNYSID